MLSKVSAKSLISSGPDLGTSGFFGRNLAKRQRQVPPSRYRKLTTHAAFGLGHQAAAAKVAEAAQQAAATIKVEAILNRPLWEHAIRCCLIAGALIWGSAHVSQLLHREADKAEAGEEAAWLLGKEQPQKRKSIARQVLVASVHAVERPLATFLPVLAIMQSVRAVAMLLDVCAIHGEKNKLPKMISGLVQNTHLAMRTIHQAILVLSEVAFIVFAVWTIIRMKERLVKVFVESENDAEVEKSATQKNHDLALERIVLPLSGLTSWLAVLSGGLMCLQVLGINIGPLLTVGGVSGVIVGLSAQSVVSNMISGVNLFLSRPFVVGDRIDIAHSSGAKLMTGYVERVDPMRTILRTDTCMPVMIPNKVLADMIISNESRIMKSYVISSFRKPRQYMASISVRHSDMGAVDQITSEMKAWLDNSPGIEKSLPYFVGLASLDHHACNLSVLMHTTAQTSRDYGTFRQRLLLDFGNIVAKNNAELALPTQIVQVSDNLSKDAYFGKGVQAEPFTKDNEPSKASKNGSQQNPSFEELLTA